MLPCWVSYPQIILKQQTPGTTINQKEQLPCWESYPQIVPKQQTPGTTKNLDHRNLPKPPLKIPNLPFDWVLGRFTRGLFRPWVVSRVGLFVLSRFALDRFPRESFRPCLVCRFALVFYLSSKAWTKTIFGHIYDCLDSYDILVECRRVCWGLGRGMDLSNWWKTLLMSNMWTVYTVQQSEDTYCGSCWIGNDCIYTMTSF